MDFLLKSGSALRAVKGDFSPTPPQGRRYRFCMGTVDIIGGPCLFLSCPDELGAYGWGRGVALHEFAIFWPQFPDL